MLERDMYIHVSLCADIFRRVAHEHHREICHCRSAAVSLRRVHSNQIGSYTALPAYTCLQTVQNDAEPLHGFGFSAPWRKSSTNDEHRPKPPCRFCDSDAVTQQVSRLLITYLRGWLGSRVVSVLDSGAERPGFKPQPRRCRVTVLGKLFTPVVPVFNSSEIFSSPFKVCEGNCGPGGK